MTIDGINKVSGSYNNSKINNGSKIKETPQKDAVNISQKARETAETAKFIEIVKNSPDVRQDKIEAAKSNLSKYMQGSRIDPKVLNKVIDRIMDTVLG